MSDLPDDFVVTARDVDGTSPRPGSYLVDVTAYDHRDEAGTDYYVPREPLGSYAFVEIDEDLADVVRGDVPDVDGTPVIYVGSSLAKHYWRSHDSETVPVDVLGWLDDRNLTLVRGVEGDWHTWEGRPEWSDTEADLTDVEVVNMAAEMDERREGDQ